MRWGGIVGLAALGLFLAPAAEAESRAIGDVVTFKNGNIYSGTLELDRIELHTDFAMLALRREQVRRIRFGDGRQVPDILYTVHGDRLSGELNGSDLEMARVLGPRITVHTADLAEIEFTGAEAGAQPARTDAVEWSNGDVLRVRVLEQRFDIQAEGGTQTITRTELRELAFNTIDGDLEVRAVRSSGERIEGRLALDTVRVQTLAGQKLSLDPARLETVAFALPTASSAREQLLGRSSDRLSVPRFRDSMGVAGSGPWMVVIPAGEYRRGSPPMQGDANERPATAVRIARPFAMGAFEVTFEEFETYCRATGRPVPDDSGWGRGLRPVMNVSWEEAKAYVAWLSRETGARYRLPSEAEWEYAARAGTSSPYWWGEKAEAGLANCAGCGSLWGGDKTARVGKFAPNPFGLYDTAGNVWEWVEDCYDDSYEKVPTDGGAAEQTLCGKRVIRGGAWSFPADESRSASRWRDFPSRHSDDTGFRVVRELEPAEARALRARAP
jgi:formylglycine-generating enzyme required for sulfatase activity